jgi:hypothetical protein
MDIYMLRLEVGGMRESHSINGAIEPYVNSLCVTGLSHKMIPQHPMEPYGL